MKPKLTLWMNLFILCLCAFQAQAQSLTPIVNRDWVTTGGTPNGIYDFQASHVIGGDGGIIVIGNSFHYGQMENFLISKYNASGGSLIFKKEYDGAASSTDFATDVTTIGNNIYVTGVEGDTVSGATYITTIKLDSVGNILWTAKYQNSVKKYNLGFRIIPDPAGTAVYVCGTSQTNTADFAVTVLKYSTSGTQTWVASYDSTGLYDAGIDMKISGSNVVVYGISGLSSVSGDIITRSYNTISGSLVSASRINNAGAYVTRPVAIAKDNAENIYLTGISGDVGRLDDIVVVKLDSTLNLKWRKYIDGGNSKNDAVSAIKIDSKNNIILTGWAGNADTSKSMWTIRMKDSVIVWNKKRLCNISGQDAKSFDVDLDVSDNIYITGKTYNGSNYDQITISYDTSGVSRWEQQYALNLLSDDEGRNVKVDSGGHIFVYGRNSTNGGAYTYSTMRYSQDKTFVPLDSTPPVKQWAYYKNSGQVVDTNKHQASYVYYYTNTANPRFYVCDQELSYLFSKHDSLTDSLQRIDIKWVQSKSGNAPSQPQYYASEQISPYLNYYRGGLPQYYEGIPGAQRVTGKNVYPNIDYQLYSDSGGLKHYYVVNVGGAPSDIQFKYFGADSTRVDTNAITVFSKFGKVKQLPYTAWQYDASNNRVAVTLTCTSVSTNTYHFTIGTYNTAKPLIIGVSQKGNPRQNQSDNLNWSTYLGGSSSDDAVKMDIDDAGAQYITGNTMSTDFPIVTGSAANTNAQVGSFLAKFDASNILKWTTFYSGSTSTVATNQQATFAVSVGSASFGHTCAQPVSIAGETLYSDLPLPGAGTSHHGTLVNTTSYDMFIAKFDAFSGSLIYGTLMGSDDNDVALAMSYDRTTNDLFVVGQAIGASFPYSNTTISGGGNFYDASGKGVILQFDCGMGLTWATGFGSPNSTGFSVDHDITTFVHDIHIDKDRNLLITGGSPFALPTAAPYNITNPTGSFYQGRTATNLYDDNAFIAKFTPTSAGAQKYALYYITEFGGTNHSSGSRISSNTQGDIYIYGVGSCPSFPIYPTSSTCPSPNTFTFVGRFSGSGAQKYCNLISGGQGFLPKAMTCSNQNFVYIFATPSNGNSGVNCVSKSGYYFDNSNATSIGNNKTVLMEIDPTNTITWATLFDGNAPRSSAGDVVTDLNHNLYICGSTFSNQTSTTATDNYPLRNNGVATFFGTYSGNKDGFIAKFDISSSVIGINEIESNTIDNIRYYPNPTTGKLTIDLTNIGGLEQMQVFDLAGKLIFTQNLRSINSKFVEADLSGLSNGLYLVSIKHSQGINSVKVILTK